MDLKQAVRMWLLIVLWAAVAMLLVGCADILDMVESVVLKDEVVAEAPATPQSEYLAEVKAETAQAAVAAAQAVVEARWGLRLEASDLASLSNVMETLQDVLQARALDSEAEALRRLEDLLRALEPLGQ